MKALKIIITLATLTILTSCSERSNEEEKVKCKCYRQYYYYSETWKRWSDFVVISNGGHKLLSSTPKVKGNRELVEPAFLNCNDNGKPSSLGFSVDILERGKDYYIHKTDYWYFVTECN